MILGNRGLFVLCVSVSAMLAGCGGGGGGGTPGSPSTNPPTSTPIGTTPTPTAVPTTKPVPTGTPYPTPTPTFAPTPQPSGPALNVPSRPFAVGDTFSYSGTTVNKFVYNGTTPDPNATPTATPVPNGTTPASATTPVPVSTTSYAVTQTVTDEGPTPFASATPYDLRTVETDASANQTITVTTDTYYSNAPYNASFTGLYTYGFASTDTSGQSITETLTGVPTSGGLSNGLIDTLPETGGAAWTNTGALTLAESESDGFSASRTVAANGTYTETDLYPQNSQFSSPAPLTATLTDNVDGSGSYSAPFGGPPNTTISYSAPASGQITITVGAGAANPYIFLVPTWYSTPLYAENDHDDGALPLPSACHVPASFGTQGDGIEEKFVKVDPVIGTLENFDQITYVAGGYEVCTTLNDLTQIFYDYSGQGGEDPLGIDFTGGNFPAETATVTSTIGLVTTSVTPMLRRDVANASAARRSATARTNFLALVERQRLERVHRATRHLRSIRLQGLHR